jgi:hypothetical protein
MYLDAKDSQELLSSLEQTLRIEFEIVDAKGDVKAKGIAGGDPVSVLEGTYTLRLLLEPEPLEKAMIVKPGQITQLELKRDKDTWTLLEKQ